MTEQLIVPIDIPTDVEVVRSPRAVLMEEFADEMDQLCMHTTILERGRDTLPTGIERLALINHETLPDEPTIRLYRGINPHSGAEIAHQVSSILKKSSGEQWGSRRTVLESEKTFAAVEAFATNPSYAHLMQMVDAASWSDGDRRFIAHRLDDIQIEMLRDRETTLIDELRRQHVWGPGGSIAQDLSPFIATATTPEQAAGFGQTLMVFDVPKSCIGSYGEASGQFDGHEMLVTGLIKPEWITAVAMFEQHLDDKGATAHELGVALGDSGAGEFDWRKAQDSQLHRQSAANFADDVAAITRDRTDLMLSATGGDAEVLAHQLAENNVTTYRSALHYVADWYMDQRSALYGRSLHVDYDRDEIEPRQFKPSDNGFYEKEQVLDIAAVRRLAEQYHRDLERAAERTLRH